MLPAVVRAERDGYWFREGMHKPHEQIVATRTQPLYLL
jgi:hypothetical protein